MLDLLVVLCGDAQCGSIVPARAALLSDSRNTSMGKSAYAESKISPHCLLKEEAEFLFPSAFLFLFSLQSLGVMSMNSAGPGKFRLFGSCSHIHHGLSHTLPLQ